MGEPGGPYHYSNTNYIVLGEIIEQVTGNSWADEVGARIAEPLGMSGTGAITGERTAGYQIVDGSFVDVTESSDPSVGGAAGGLRSTGRDLLRFAARPYATEPCCHPRSQRAMRAFVPGEDLSQFGIDHGYGDSGSSASHATRITIIGHMGTGETGSAYVGYDADSGTTVAVTTNTGVAGPQAIMAVESASSRWPPTETCGAAPISGRGDLHGGGSGCASPTDRDGQRPPGAGRRDAPASPG